MPSAASPLVIAVAGGTGSGKTSIVKALVRRTGKSSITVIDQDSYYKGLSLPLEPAGVLNFDDPVRIDHDLILEHLRALVRGESVNKPRYDFATHSRLTETDTIPSAPTILLEGLFAYWDPRARPLFHCKVFVDAAADIRFARRLQRDIQQRGRTAESVIEQYLTSVRPMHLLHVDPLKKSADMVILNETHVDEAVNEMVSLLRKNQPGGSKAKASIR